MSRELLETIVPGVWDSPKSQGAPRTRWLQQLNDLIRRPVLNRLSNSTINTAVASTGNPVSTGVGIGPIQPKRYGEFTVKARVTFKTSGNAVAYVYVYRTTGAIPANGAPPNAGDVIVGGDAFMGGSMVTGQSAVGALSYLDSGLNENAKYHYYLATAAPNGQTATLFNNSQLLVMERS